MKKRIRLYFIIAGSLFLLFALYTAGVCTIDVRPVGPHNTMVGFGTINKYMFDLFGESLLWYHVTDCLGKATLLIAFGFAVLGIVQLVQRKSIKLVDRSILLLGGFYLLVFAFYGLFEVCVVNYRPVIMEKALEASYPSSHTMMVVCIMSAAIMQFQLLLKNKAVRITANAIAVLIIVVMVIGRFLSGVHWFTDIIGGLLLGAALVMLYYASLQYAEPVHQKTSA